MAHLLPHPDPMPLREVLRGLRHGLRRSRRALQEMHPADALPGPAGLIAGPVLNKLDALAESVDAAGTDLAKRLLGGAAHLIPTFPNLIASPDLEDVFAEAVYHALRSALHRLGGDAFISEVAARRAYATARRLPEMDVPTFVAADLVLALVKERVVRDVVPTPKLRVPADQVMPVAIVAVLLWLLAEREEADADEALHAAIDIAMALGDDIAQAVLQGARSRLAQLLQEFAPHV